MTDPTTEKAKLAKQALSEALGRPLPDLGDEVLLTELVVESFALIETVIELQESLGIRLVQADLRDVKTVGDLVRVCAERA